MNSLTPFKTTTQATSFLKQFVISTKQNRAEDGWRFRNLGLVMALPSLAFGIMVFSFRTALPIAAQTASAHSGMTSVLSSEREPAPQWRVLSQEGSSHAGLYAPIIFFDEQNGLALNALGLAGTTDGGANWTTRLDSGDRGFYSMRFVDRKKGWIVGAEKRVTDEHEVSSKSYQPMILETADGGVTWQTINLDHFLGSEGTRFSRFSSMCVDPSGRAWIVGDGGVVEGTIKSAELHASDVTATPAELNDVSCLDSGEIWSAGRNGLIMHYRQKEWDSIQYPDSNAVFSRVKFNGNAVWLIGGTQAKGDNETQGLLLKSDNGKIWENKTPADAGLLSDLDLSKGAGWLVGARGSIYHTSNGGGNWRKETSPTEKDLFCVFFLPTKQGWIGGDNLTVLDFKPHALDQ